MTGYGRAAGQTDLGTFGIEIKSVNNRFFDFSARLPREWSGIESPLRELVHSQVHRGKIDVWIHWSPPPGVTIRVDLSEDMIGEVVKRFRTAGERLGETLEIPWGDLFKLPGVLNIRPPEIDLEALFEGLGPLVEKALSQLNAMRLAEGEATAVALSDHLTRMRKTTDTIEAHRGSALEKQRERLRKVVDQMDADIARAISADRLEAEVLLFADRADITEELVRLRSHFDAFQELMDLPAAKPAGRRMEFLTQEILRETNTIGSKGRDSEISASVVTLKHETEKVREQLQNIE
jgi:uncharacterized protein (TIGR00255 family)